MNACCTTKDTMGSFNVKRVKGLQDRIAVPMAAVGLILAQQVV
jgi:hypothetical protein